MKIKINDNTYLGNTAGVVVDATPVDDEGYEVLGKDLIELGIDVDPNDPTFLYWVNGREVTLINEVKNND